MRHGRTSSVAVAMMMSISAASAMGDLIARNLGCEYATNPLGMDVARPRLNWTLASDQRGQVQTAYQILVAADQEALKAGRADLWDSGKVVSGESIGIVYEGKPLASGVRAHWKVRVWDREDKASTWSAPAWWEMGLLRPDDWNGKWIGRGDSVEAEAAPGRALAAGTAPSDRDQAERDLYEDHPAPMLRKEFEVSRNIRNARLYVSGLGYYDLRVNGRRVGDPVLDPAWTTYSKRVFYSTYDVTALLRKGPNALGAMVGNGWYNPLPLRMWGRFNLREHLTIGPPRLILQLNVEYDDGTRQSVVTDNSWRVADSAILRNSIYLGEVYDARRKQLGWDRPGFDDGAWKPAAIINQALGPLQAQPLEPIKITRTIKAAKITEPKPGVYIFDMGQNFAGWVVLRVTAPAGTIVKLRYGELLRPDGTLNVMTSVCGQIKREGMGGLGAPPLAYQGETYICGGEGPEAYAPRFTFHGFRYVEVTGLSGKPDLEAVTGHRLNSAVDEVGSFECSNEMFNRIQEMVRWTLLSNMFSVQSDCPHREKFGYGGDIVASSEMAILNLGMERFYAKAVQDLEDAADPNGGMTETAPFVGIADEGLGGNAGPVGWGTAHPVLQWNLYRYYGNKELLAQQYDVTKRWVALLESKAVDGILDNGISDHESLVPKPKALTGTAFYYHNVHLLSRIAGVLGRSADADRYSTLARTIREAFNRKFLTPGTGRYDIATQACQAFALHFGLVPENERKAAVDVLVDDIMTTHKGHLSTGIFGTKYMLNALTDAGLADIAYTIVNQKTFPGWGHMLENGATTLWEHWEYSDNVYSHNHPMFGSVSEWFFKALAGINADADAVGFDKIVIRPCVVGDLTAAKARYDSIRGMVTSEWTLKGNTLTLEVTIPTNTTATVYVPAGPDSVVSEGKTPAEKAEAVQFLRKEDGAMVYKVESGAYRFVSEGFAGPAQP